MPLLSWPPGAMKELLRYVPTLLNDVVDWRVMTREVSALSKRWMTGEGADEARAALAHLLPTQLRYTRKPQMPELNDQQRSLLGEVILELYFTQVLSSGPLFLDLRLSHFGREHDQWTWLPGNLWGEYSPGFARGLREVYRGFYEHSPLQLRHGLTELGLINSAWPESEKEELEKLFRASFGGEANVPMKFELEAFQHSFQNVFKFLMERKVQLGPDFVLLGLNLITLYLALEELGQSWSVPQHYQTALKRLSARS